MWAMQGMRSHVADDEVHGCVCLRRQLAVGEQAADEIAGVAEQPLSQEPAAERLWHSEVGEKECTVWLL